MFFLVLCCDSSAGLLWKPRFSYQYLHVCSENLLAAQGFGVPMQLYQISVFTCQIFFQDHFGLFDAYLISVVENIYYAEFGSNFWRRFIFIIFRHSEQLRNLIEIKGS